MVGKTGFEPATPWSQTKCSTKLSHFPKMVRSKGFEPLTFWFVAKHSIQLSYERMSRNQFIWILNKYQNGGSSGNRTSDTGIFSPLLYRLSYEAKWRSQRDSNPRSSAWQADVLTSCTMRPNGCGRRIWTYDLWVMSPTSYRTAPSRDINGGGKGIRTPAPLSRPPGFQDRSLQPDLGIPPLSFQTTNWL